MSPSEAGVDTLLSFFIYLVTKDARLGVQAVTCKGSFSSKNAVTHACTEVSQVEFEVSGVGGL
jgi:hypothetical protein